MVPVTLITGFLGAGKTSLLNHILANANGLRIAVLVNDFGAVNIDASLIKRRDGEMISLENGCICCSLSDGFLASVAKVIRRPDPPERIVIETSGVSDPIEIAQALSDPDLQAHAPLDGVITVVDAVHILGLDAESQLLARRQISAADLALLNKSDLATPSELDESENWIRDVSQCVRVIPSRHAEVPLEILLGIGGTALELPQHPEHHHAHKHYESFVFETTEPIPMARLHQVLGTLPDSIYRVKGTVNIEERPTHRCILQFTGKRATIEIGDPWQDATPATQLVFIGRRGSLNQEATRAALHRHDVS